MKKIIDFFPIKKEEVVKFVITSLMMLMILFIYSIERTVKDTIVIDEMGADLLSAIKLYCTLPMAIIIMLIYAKMSVEIDKTKIFHIFNIFFISYFIIFTFIIAPNISFFHLDLSSFKNNYKFLNYFFSIIENWSYCLYFVFAELWGSVMLSLMFWQTANQVFEIKQAKRLYPLFGLVAQLGMIISGILLKILSDKSTFNGGWQESLEYINKTVMIAGITLSFLYWILTNILVSPKIINAEVIKKKKKESFLNSLKYIFKSKYIGLIATIIICYGISINILEAVWKAQASLVYQDKQDYTNFMANLQTLTGSISMITMISGSYILNKVAWKKSALLTPIIIFITGIIFYIFSIYQKEISMLFPSLNITPIMIAVNIGLLQNVMVKSTKYAFFDATKEIAYIPLSEELKSKGKAAADVIGGRLGKSGGALIQQILLIISLSIYPEYSIVSKGTRLISLSPMLFIIFIVIMVVWIIAVENLSKEFDAINKIKKKGS